LSILFINMSGQARGLFGVFDGHGGKDVASFALERIGPLFDKQYAKKSGGGAEDVVSLFFEAASPAQKQKKAAAEGDGNKGNGDEPGAALKRAFVEIDEEFLNQHGRRLPTTGSCGLVCYIERGIVWSAIVGDSRFWHLFSNPKTSLPFTVFADLVAPPTWPPNTASRASGPPGPSSCGGSGPRGG
jgi:serine/threonine protein phosphatase PrpC